MLVWTKTKAFRIGMFVLCRFPLIPELEKNNLMLRFSCYPFVCKSVSAAT